MKAPPQIVNCLFLKSVSALLPLLLNVQFILLANLQLHHAILIRNLGLWWRQVINGLRSAMLTRHVRQRLRTDHGLILRHHFGRRFSAEHAPTG